MQNFCTPPVIRVFLSSTFADMDKERSYFNEVIAPKISRACADRGVSFFSVDLRWGITQEEQIDGQVLPICLSEIDKCRPYFIGIIGNRYGSVLETVPEKISQSIPWLSGKEGHSITELEMLYAVLDHDRESSANNCAFYFRSDRLSQELYSNLTPENADAAAKLNQLKDRIAGDINVPSSGYDTVEEFGDMVMRDLLNWLDINFPESEDISNIRKNWYNSEILRNYVDDAKTTDFINSYLSESNKPLLIYGDGARGKTTHLTAWQPLNGQKILVNCGADDSLSYWPSIARQIINELNEADESYGYPELSMDASAMFQLMSSFHKNDSSDKRRLNSDFYFVTDSDRENFRRSFIKWLEGLELKNKVTVVINDLNLLEDERSKFLSWLPSSMPKNLNFICTTNDDNMVQTVEILGWNVKEMPVFENDGVERLINEHLHTYGKNLSENQFNKLMSSVVIKYPGQLRFIISFLMNYGRFDNLDTLITDVSDITDICDIYRYVYDYLIKDYSSQEITTIRAVLGLVRCSNLSLAEGECFRISQKLSACTSIEWAHVCRLFEQFDIIKGDYWNIRNEELEKFIDFLLSEKELQTAHSLLGEYFFEQLKNRNDSKSALQNIRDNTAYAKECLEHYKQAQNWDKLVLVLSDRHVLYYLSKLDWYCVQSAWVHLFLYSDITTPDLLIDLVKQYWNTDNDDKIIALKLGGFYKTMGFKKDLDKIYEIVGKDQILISDQDDNLSEMISEDFPRVYGTMHEMKTNGDFRALHQYTKELFTKEISYNEIELCQILFFKADAEEHLRLIDEAVKTTNDYYLTAIKTGALSEMIRALSMKGDVLYRRGECDDAKLIHQKVARIALNEGKLREHLAAMNILGMCHYRMSEYNDSIAVFDKLASYWGKLSDSNEIGVAVMNKCNALCFKGDINGALICAEDYYNQISNDSSLKRICASLLGNMGRYATDLGLFEKAENYLLLSIEYSKELGQEPTLLNAYTSLIELYTLTEKFGKIIDYRKEQMDFLWDREAYYDVIAALDKTISFLLQYKYVAQANKLDALWKEKFSTIPGGLEFFEQRTKAEALDVVKINKLKEEAIIAKSERNTQKEAQLYCDIAQALHRTNKDTATEYLLTAALLYKGISETNSFFDCISNSIILQFNDGAVRNEDLLTKALKHADNNDVNAIVDLWLKLAKASNAAKEAPTKKVFGLFSKKSPESSYELLCSLVQYITSFESLVTSCLMDVSRQIVSSCTSEELINIIDKVPESHKKMVSDSLASVMIDQFNKNHALMLRDYLSPQSTEKVELYEDYLVFLKHVDNVNTAGIAGNLALIFRRRKDKEKTLYYHTMSIEAFKKADKTQDYLIEVLNMATAYFEFNELDKAFDLLRKGLQEALENNEENLVASIAGNLASQLIKFGRTDNTEEILRCFELEENFFRSVGNMRDLSISLLNQLMYLQEKADPSEWLPKLAEATEIVKENDFKEFMPVLAKLEWFASKNDEPSDKTNEISIEDKVKTLLSTNKDYSLVDIRLEDGAYHFICIPTTEEKTGVEQLHILCDRNASCEIEIVCLYRPNIQQPNNLPKLKEYINWWNSFEDYLLNFNEEENVLQAHTNLVAPNWEELGKLLEVFLSLWKADRINTLTLILGILELPLCQSAKLKLINPDE